MRGREVAKATGGRRGAGTIAESRRRHRKTAYHGRQRDFPRVEMGLHSFTVNCLLGHKWLELLRQ